MNTIANNIDCLVDKFSYNKLENCFDGFIDFIKPHIKIAAYKTLKLAILISLIVAIKLLVPGDDNSINNSSKDNSSNKDNDSNTKVRINWEIHWSCNRNGSSNGGQNHSSQKSNSNSSNK